jgi:hypothetical protein
MSEATSGASFSALKKKGGKMRIGSHEITKLAVRDTLSSHSTRLGLVTTAAVSLYLFIDVIAEPKIRDSTSVEFGIIGITKLSYILYMCSVLIAGVVLFLRRKLFLSVCYLAAGATAYASCFADAALKDDRLTFPSGSHREIANIYRKQDVNFDVNSSTPHLTFLDRQCHPPNGCECWVLIDPGHRSAVDNDLGGWRRPTAAIFLPEVLPLHFGIVNVRVLDSSAYSVLGCGMDIRGWIPE